MDDLLIGGTGTGLWIYIGPVADENLVVAKLDTGSRSTFGSGFGNDQPRFAVVCRCFAQDPDCVEILGVGVVRQVMPGAAGEIVQSVDWVFAVLAAHAGNPAPDGIVFAIDVRTPLLRV